MTSIKKRSQNCGERLWEKIVQKIPKMREKISDSSRTIFAPREESPQLERGRLGMPIREEPGIRNSQAFPQPRVSPETKSSGGLPAFTKESTMRFENVLIVGGMDFFGAALVHQLNAVGFREIAITDELREDSCRTMAPLKFREFFSPEEFEEVSKARFRPFSDYSHIFYLGPWKTSLFGRVKSLFEATEKGGKRFIAVSSVAALGPRQPCSTEDRNLPEHFRPLTQGGLVAGLFDRHVFSANPRSNCLALKSHCLFGPGERMNNGIGGIIKACHAQLRSTGIVRLPAALAPTAPEARRQFDFFPVQDAARLAVFLAQNSLAKGVYELGSGISFTVGELVDVVCEVVGAGKEIVWDENCLCEPPPLQPEKAWLGRLPETGWQVPSFDLREAVRHYITEYLDADAFLGDEIPRNPSPALSASSGKAEAIPQKRKLPQARAGIASKE